MSTFELKPGEEAVQPKANDFMFSIETLRGSTARNKTEEGVRHSEERYRRLYNDIPVMLHSIDHDGRLISVSNYWLATLGYERSEVLGRVSTEFYTVASRSYATKVVQPDFFRTGACHEVPYQIVKKNGEILDVLLSATAELGNKGKIIRALAVLIDVTERKRADEEIERLNTDLAARAAELEVANRELEAFNYTVAHDLRKPLTVVNGYCQLLMAAGNDKLDEVCKSYLREASDGTLRMNRLIDALLGFSSLAHIEPCREAVDLSSLAQEVATELQLAEPERRVTLKFGEGIIVNGDAGLLRVVLDNLIGNAWKYTSRQQEAFIEFGVTTVGEETAWFVTDNGPGFEMTDAEKLFVPFQRIAEKAEYAGHGIGLATVERIIRRHGGRVWAEGGPGKGATFMFSLGV